MSSAADAKRGVGLWAADAKRGVGLPADDGERFLALPPDGGSSVGNGSSSSYQDLDDVQREVCTRLARAATTTAASRHLFSARGVRPTLTNAHGATAMATAVPQMGQSRCEGGTGLEPPHIAHAVQFGALLNVQAGHADIVVSQKKPFFFSLFFFFRVSNFGCVV